MGVWISAKGKYEINPPVDDNLIREYIEFSEQTCPDSYANEKFFNVWFFDQENRLMCHAGKFAEPSVWIDHIREYFFEPRGYELLGDVEIIGECDDEWFGRFWEFEKSKEDEYNIWRERKTELMS